MREANDLGYTVADADRDAGFIRAERDRTGLMDALLGATESIDQLTLTVFPDEDGSTVLRVVPGGYEVETGGENRGGRVSHGGSREAWKDVQTILQACGEPSTVTALAQLAA